MTAKHTPGPWHLHKDYMVTGPDQYKFVADCRSSEAYRDGGRANTIANARLIASAPELLAALRAALTDKANLYANTFDSRMDNDPTVQIIRAAIAKATGE